MFCPKCGKQILDSSKFCPACGCRIGDVKTMSAHMSPPSAAYGQPGNIQQPPSYGQHLKQFSSRSFNVAGVPNTSPNLPLSSPSAMLTQNKINIKKINPYSWLVIIAAGVMIFGLFLRSFSFSIIGSEENMNWFSTEPSSTRYLINYYAFDTSEGIYDTWLFLIAGITSIVGVFINKRIPVLVSGIIAAIFAIEELKTILFMV